MVDAPYCEACDSGHEVPCTCGPVKRPFDDRSEVTTPKLSRNCSTCGKGALERFEDQCESCFTRDKITPLVALRELTLKEVARIDGLLTTKLEKLARSSRHNLNLSFTCVCGQQLKAGLEFIAHLPDCSGPKPQTHRNGFHAKLMKQPISLKDLG